MTRSNTIPPRTLQHALTAAHKLGLEPFLSDAGNFLGMTCPICRDHDTPATAYIVLRDGILIPECAGCNNDVDPGILETLGAIDGLIQSNGNGNEPSTNGTPRNLGTQTWRAFEQAAGEDVPCIIKGLWPESALGFIGAAPKAGKTWLGLDIAIAVATGTPVFGSFPVPRALPVLYVALEGHKAAIRTRIGCIARGHGVHPEDVDALTNLHLAYKPKGINLAQPDWAAALCESALEINARFVIVDVLRRAAQIKENDASSFMELVDLLNPISDAGTALAMLHHFNKVNEQTSQRTPAERMAGSGAMFGAFDVGLFITKSESGARRLTIHTDIRDLPAPPRFLVNLQGVGTGQHGGFTYRDNLRLTMEDAPAEKHGKAPAHEIRDWIINDHGGAASPGEIQLHFGISDTLLRSRRDELSVLGIQYLGSGRSTRYEAPLPQTPNNPEVGATLGSPEPPQTPNLLRRGSGVWGQEPVPTQDRPKEDFGVVTLLDDPDAGYWSMLDAIREPEAKENE